MDVRRRTATRVQEIAPFHVMEVQTAARALEAAGRDVVHMEIGEPDFPTPEPVLAAARDALDGGGIYYTSALGLSELRAAIARHYDEHYGVAVAPERIVVTAGSSAALLLTLALLVDRDEQILMSDPGYPCNRHFIRTLEGEAVGLPVGPESNYQLDSAVIAGAWTPRTRGALIATPSNPTGTTVVPAEMQRIAATVAARGGALIVDEIYLGLSYAGRPQTALALTDDIFVISSFSKYFNMTGWRLGWLVAPERHVRDLEKLAQNLYISPPDSVAAGRARLLRAGDARDSRGAPRRIPGAPRLPGASLARAGLRDSAVCRPADSSSTPTARRSVSTASASAAKRLPTPGSHSRPASISGRIAPATTCVSPIRSQSTGCAKACAGSPRGCRDCADDAFARRDGPGGAACRRARPPNITGRAYAASSTCSGAHNRSPASSTSTGDAGAQAEARARASPSATTRAASSGCPTT